MQLLKIGNVIINPNNVTHVRYSQEIEPGDFTGSGKPEPYRRCDISFKEDNFVAFFDDEADQIWAYLSGASTHLTPNKQLNAAA